MGIKLSKSVRLLIHLENLVSHKIINRFTCSCYVGAERQVELVKEGRDVSSQAWSAVLNINTLFSSSKTEALFPLVYFNFNFYVRNSTWNADTGGRRVREIAHGT